MNDSIISMLPAAENRSFLTGLYSWGIEVIKVIQTIENPVLTALLKFITALGTEAFYVPVILFIFWWIDENRGLRFGILIIISAWINSFMKDLWKQPRPFNLVPSLGLAHESSYGAPSGHAQMSLTFWFPMAAWCAQAWAARSGKDKRLLIWAGAIFFVLLIAFTRLYLGVHFPTDIFTGWVLAGIILAVYFLAGPRLEKLFAQAGTRSLNICAAVIALTMSGLYPRDRSMSALFLGFCLGYAIMKKYFPFSARGEIKGKKPGMHIMFIRCLTGFAGMAIIYLGLRLVFPGEGSLFSGIPVWGKASPYYELGRFMRYGLVGMWVSAGAPRIFQQMGLATGAKPGDCPFEE